MTPAGGISSGVSLVFATAAAIGNVGTSGPYRGKTQRLRGIAAVSVAEHLAAELVYQRRHGAVDAVDCTTGPYDEREVLESLPILGGPVGDLVVGRQELREPEQWCEAVVVLSLIHI